MDMGFLDFTHTDVGSVNHTGFNLRGTDSRLADLRPGDAGILDLCRADGGFRDLASSDSQILNLCCGNGGILNMRFADGSLLDVCRSYRRRPDLQGTDRAVLQVPGANGAHGQLDAADGACRQLTGRDHAALHAVQRRAEGTGGVLPQQAVVGVLRHAQGNSQTQPGHDHAHRIAQEDAVQDAEVAVFLGIVHAQEVHIQRDGGQVAAIVQLGLRRFAQFPVDIAFAGVIVLLGIADGEVSPLHMGISPDVRAVNVLLREIQHMPVLVLAGGYDARDHAGFIQIITDTQQVFPLTDFNIRVTAHAVDEVHIVPVPGQLGVVLADDAFITQHGFHRVDMLKGKPLCRAGEVGVHGEVMGRFAPVENGMRSSRAAHGSLRLVAENHVVHEVIEDVPGIDLDLGERGHNAIDAEGLIAHLPRLHDLPGRRGGRALRPGEGQVVRGHVAALAVRGGHLIPAVVGLGDEHDLPALGVLPEPLVVRAGAGAKVELARLGGDGVHRPASGLGDQRHTGRHGGGHGCAEDVADLQVRPLAALVKWVGHGQLPLAVEGFCDGAGGRREDAQTVAGEVRRVRWEYADQG